jgi:hypothetical protein
VFSDADVTWRPGALDALWDAMDRQGADVFSVFPRQQADTIGERLLVPIIDEVLLAFLPHQLLRAAAARSAAVANGQTLAFHRRAYDGVGGHAAVANKIVEDIALARRTRRLGWHLGLALGGDLIGVRMYQGYRQAVRGLGKSLRAAHANRDVVLAASAAGNLVAYTLPWLRIRRGASWQLAASLTVLERLLVNAKTGRGDFAEALLVPVTAPAALPVYAAALRRTATWKGRRYR